MEKVATKKYSHNHASTFKNRDKMGLSNRFVRQHRATEERKNTRMQAMAKHRRIPLAAVNEKNKSLLEESVPEKKAVPKPSSKVEKTPKQETLSRKEMLMKWRAERELKRKADAAEKTKKTTFAVRQVKYDEKIVFSTPANNKQKNTIDNESKSTKRVTRSSARLACKPSNKKDSTAPKKAVSKAQPVTRLSATKKAPTKITTATPKDQPGKRVTRQTAKKSGNAPNKKEKVVEITPSSALETQKEGDKKQKTVLDPNVPSMEKEDQKEKSFAPTNFNFSVPEGVNSFLGFKFQPLSPSSAEGFFAGASFPSPAKQRELITEGNFVLSGQDWIKEHVETTTMETQEQVTVEQGVVDSKRRDGERVADDPVVEEEHGSAYFRDLVVAETKKLNTDCQYWEKVLEEGQELSEEVHGSIRTAIGQAQLLISQRFKQFSGLIDLSEDQTAEKKATSSDLQGFWDMIYFQVEDVKNKMAELEKRKQNNWVEEVKQVKKRVKKTKAKVNNKPEQPKAARPGKSSIQEMRAKMRAKMAEHRKKAMETDKENSAFVTILTPVKKSSANADAEVVLTPVRRSLRNTPLQRVAPSSSLAVVTTPKLSSTSPGLRLTPEVAPLSTTVQEEVGDLSKSQDDPMTETASSCPRNAEDGMKEEIPEQPAVSKECVPVDQDMPLSTESQGSGNEHAVPTIPEEPMTSTGSSSEEEPAIGSRTRSALRSTGAGKPRKSRKSRVSFQSPAPAPSSTAGGTPGPLIFTPGTGSTSCYARSIGAGFTPVAISLETPEESDPVVTPEGKTTEGTPLRRSSRKRRVPTPYHSDKSQSRLTEDELEYNVPVKQAGTPVGNHGFSLSDSDDDESRTKALRRSRRRSKVATPKGVTPKRVTEEEVLPDKYFLPSGSEEEDAEPHQVSDVDMEEGDPKEVVSALDNSPEPTDHDTPSSGESRRIHLIDHVHNTCDETPYAVSRQNTPLKTTLFVSPESPAASALLPLTPSQKSKAADQSLTPASALAALNLDGTPVSTATRRDSVFYAPVASHLLPDGKAVDNLICFSPIKE